MRVAQIRIKPGYKYQVSINNGFLLFKKTVSIIEIAKIVQMSCVFLKTKDRIVILTTRIMHFFLYQSESINTSDRLPIAIYCLILHLN